MEGRRLKGYTKAKERYQNYVDFLLKHLDGRKNKDEVITQREVASHFGLSSAAFVRRDQYISRKLGRKVDTIHFLQDKLNSTT